MTEINNGVGRPRVAISFAKTGRTKQSFRKECDINAIMRKYNRTGLLDHMATVMPQYGDYTNAVEYQDAKNSVIQAEAAFASLPSEVRSRMDNDPGRFLDFMADPENKDEAIALGLFPSPADPPTEAPAASSPENRGETPTPGEGS